jgi:hypothetical protein
METTALDGRRMQHKVTHWEYNEHSANLQPAQDLGMAVIHHIDPARTVRDLERLLGLSDRMVRRR